MNDLDKKIKNVMPEESIYKDKDSYSIFSGKNIPSFIKDWLIKKFTDEEEFLYKDELLEFLNKLIPLKESQKRIKTELQRSKQELTILTRVLVEPDVKKDVFKFSIPDLGVGFNEGRVQNYLIEKHKELKSGEVWGIFKLIHVSPEKSDDGHITILDYKPFKPYDVDLNYYCEGRKEFTLEEWVDLLIRSMEYNPEGFSSLDQKLLFISRLLVFVEPRLNLIELAPKSTGKSYVFNNLSKYGWCVSGGTVTRAKMFYDITRNTPGFITRYDFVSIDEIQTIKFSDEDEMRGALKNYLEFGKYTVANFRGISDAGLILLGNLAIDQDWNPLNYNFFSGLPECFQESALIDRFHGFIEGWRLPRINEDMKVKGYALNVEYFSEILHVLRESSYYASLVDDLLEIPKKADTRDVNAIKRISTAYLRLLFPHVKSLDDITKQEFEIYCLKPAIEKRGIIRRQLHLIDLEYKEDLPNISIKNSTLY